MKMLVMCEECIEEHIQKNSQFTGSFGHVEINDEVCIEFTCPNGHTTINVFQIHKFETLFELGSNAIIDGYNREAVMSFAASLERFYEFTVKVLMYGVNTEEFSELWKKVASQSERQLGAYMFIYMNNLNIMPPLLSQDDTTFRNKVAHKGYIPSKQEALDFGQNVADIIISSLKEFKVSHKAGINELMWENLQKGHQNANTRGQRRATNAPKTIINSINDDLKTIDLKQEIEKLETLRKHYEELIQINHNGTHTL